MNTLTPDDLLPLEEYTARRREFFEAHLRYLDRYRRVRIGPRLTLVFENRQTLWFRVQEMLRVARISEARLIRHELDLYNRLLPGPGRLQAALLIAVEDDARLSEELAPWRGLSGTDLRLHLGPAEYPADLLTCRPEDRAIGAAHWAQFVLDPAARRCLADRRCPVHFTVTLPDYRHASAVLDDDLRRSLLDDLREADAG
jgi:hypothetical protein